jgi:hypothetical protein
MILLLVAAGVGLALNPSEKDHKAKLYTILQKKVSGEGILGAIGAEVAKRTDALQLTGIEYQNYIVFSTVKRKGELVTIGAFGKIFVVDDRLGLD